MMHVTKTVVSLILASALGSQSVSPSLDLNLKNKLEKSAVSLNNEEKIFTRYLQKYLFYLVNGPSAPEPSLAGPRARL